ncbi:MAG TPA: hypothetical protein ENK38_01320 [Gammaproteobacteria bacterium]|nr:hypothetical protein [Gammaproteobacteria bacterium]
MTLINLNSAKENQRKRDFVLLAPPRSGSNMMASAINSHPSLVCFGDYFAAENFDWLGGDVTGDMLDGELVHFMIDMRSGFVSYEKLIVLFRDPADIVRSRLSLFNRKFSHILEDGKTVSPFSGGSSSWSNSTVEAVNEEIAEMRAYADPRNALFINYEHLVDTKTDVLNRAETNKICDFLCVDREAMIPITQKLQAVKVKG